MASPYWLVAIFMEINVPLSQFSNYRTGGPADFFIQAKSIDEIKGALAWAGENNHKIFVLGGGTNILFPDAGFRGLVIKISNDNCQFYRTRLVAGAGVMMPDLVNASIEQELTGLEGAGGLPGTLGGAVRGNAGCFGGEIKDVVQSVTAVTPAGEILTFNNQDCRFAYRHSRFKEEKLIAVEAVLNLKKDLPREKIAEIAQILISYRIERQPLDWPNCGSVFKNCPVGKVPAEVAERFKAVIKTDPFPVIPTAALIHEAGLKGHTVGGAQVSEKHPNFIINLGSATSANILAVLSFVKADIKQKFGVDLEVEIELV